MCKSFWHEDYCRGTKKEYVGGGTGVIQALQKMMRNRNPCMDEIC